VSSLETFVCIHDQQLLLSCEKQGIFANIPKLRYVFVGKNGVSKLSHLGDKVIVARNLPDNIEQYPLLVSYTAWYALVRNKLLTTPNVAVLEYDVTLSSSFDFAVDDVLSRRGPCLLGFRAYALKSPIYFNATPMLEPALKKAYDVDIHKLIDDYVRETGKNAWCSSSNVAADTETFGKFVEWFWPIAQLVKDTPLGAHVCERCIKVFAILNKLPTFLLKDVLQHTQQKSHGIEALV
jgi:hypothetical protein